MNKASFIIRLLLSPLFFTVMLLFFCFVGIVFFPVGALWIVSVLWTLCFKWVFKILGIEAPKDTDDLQEVSYIVPLLVFKGTVTFVKHGRLS